VTLCGDGSWGSSPCPRHDLTLDQGKGKSLVICGTGIEPIAQMEAILSQRDVGTIEKTWLGTTLGANSGPTIAVAVVAPAAVTAAKVAYIPTLWLNA
jgi:hypothetical protein